MGRTWARCSTALLSCCPYYQRRPPILAALLHVEPPAPPPHYLVSLTCRLRQINDMPCIHRTEETGMAVRTWVGGHNGNDALTADNWSPAGVPQLGDNLTVVTGTLNITKTDLAGNKLNLLDDAVGAGPVVLDLNGKARIEAGGSLNFGDPLTVNATGRDSLRADDIFTI